MTTADHAPGHRFEDLSALFVNCTLKRSPEASHTQGLIEKSVAVMAANGVATEVIRAVDHDIATGVWPDMTEHGWASDAWPGIYDRVMAADILVLAGPIWLVLQLGEPVAGAALERDPVTGALSGARG